MLVGPGSGDPAYSVSIRLTPAGGGAFDRIAAVRYRYYSPTSATPDPRSQEAVDVDGVLIAVPAVESGSYNGDLSITGDFDRAQGQRVVQDIRNAAGVVAPRSATSGEPGDA